uniref:Ion transport domain-containing protein n=1 Tax=Caenorhabditis japonica TaxID=281687 RepID=A0A8R1EUZ8_CAEJA
MRLSACRAAALSTTMLTRRKSSIEGTKTERRRRGESIGGAFTDMINIEPTSIINKSTAFRIYSVKSATIRSNRTEKLALMSETSAMLSSPTWPPRPLCEWCEFTALRTEIISKTDLPKYPIPELLHERFLRDMVRIACLLSMISVCLHTPETIKLWPPLNYFILANDVIVTLIFIIEAAVTANQNGLTDNPNSYLRDRWYQFEFFLLINHVLSCVIHVYELCTLWFPSLHLAYYPWLGALRSARPFIFLRFIRSIVRFKLPKNRIKLIMKRSSQQIQNVTIFFMFFVFSYAILGVQLFGRLNYHCVVPETDPYNVTIRDLAIPDTMCSQPGAGGYECPSNMVCMRLQLKPQEEGFYGQFSDFASSLFTVYLAASQEGWVYVLYDCLDSLPSFLAFFYFVTLIFFLAWLVKNVFIAVITETFAEIRVQFSEMWQTREATSDHVYTQKLEKDEDGWKLVEVDKYNRAHSNNSLFLHTIVTSLAFQTVMQLLILANAIFHATFVFYHDESDQIRKIWYYYVEVGFTVLFNTEVVIKIYAFGWKAYIARGQHKFDCILCVGSSLNAIWYLYETNIFTYFQVFRIARLIKASPMLEDFVYKIFGPGKKLGGLVIFTGILLIVTSAISLQLFCYVPNLNKFTNFPVAFMSMFQIITQEGWTDVVIEILRACNEQAVPFVAIYFVAYHLLVTLFVLSLFVAVILDNLEMDEELKKVKQLKAREQDTIKTTLPMRLQIFNRFPTAPTMVTMKKVPSEFPLPKIRDSFTRQFADEFVEPTEDPLIEIGFKVRSMLSKRGPSKETRLQTRIRHVGHLSSKTILNSMLNESNRNRALFSESNQHLASLTRSNTSSKHGKSGTLTTNSRSRTRGLASLKGKNMVEGFKENGDLRPEDTARKVEKHGEIDFKALQMKRAHAEITSDFLAIMTYLDWAMVLVTTLSCCSMLWESPWPTTGENLIFNNFYLQIAEYIFVLVMSFELIVKCIANGLFFTPKALVTDVGDILTIFIYITSLIFLIWMPNHIEINSWAQLLMICRAMRPLRVYALIPHIRRVVVELCRGFREILLVTILLVVLMFIFASFGVQLVGGKLASCNDPKINDRENCTGIYGVQLFVTRMEVFGKHDPSMHPSIWVPRVWTNPRNFNFDHIGNAMLALFETLSYKGWNVVRDILYLRHGAWAVLFIHIYVFIGCMIGLTLFVGVVVANYTENRGTALLTVDQRRWHDLKARLKMAQPLHVPPKPPESAKLRCYLYDLTTSRWFKQLFAALVVLNSFTLVIPWNVMEEQDRKKLLLSLTVISAICNVLFTLECLLKMIAFTISGFWQSRRNRIDMIITILVPAYFAGGITEWKRLTYTYGYLVVILRFFTIAGRKSTLKMLMLTVVMSMVRSSFIIAAMFLLVLFYANAGVVLFGMVKYGQAVGK